MKYLKIFFLLLIVLEAGLKDTYSQEKPQDLSGSIGNYEKSMIYLFKCYGDSLIFVDSTRTDSRGKFIFNNLSLVKNYEDVFSRDAIFKVIIDNGQYFFLIYDTQQKNEEWGGEIYTYYENSIYSNIATDSLVVINIDSNKKYNNEKFIEFQKMLSKINVAENYLLPYLINYPIYDSFHKQIEQEYLKRYVEMDSFVKQLMLEKPESLVTKIALAFYYPVLTGWIEETPFRDSIIELHYFDYFNPADSFFLHTNILPEKIDMYINVCINRRDKSGNLYFNNEDILTNAILKFLEKVENASVPNDDIFNFCLDYIVLQLKMKDLYRTLNTLRDRYPVFFKIKNNK